MSFLRASYRYWAHNKVGTQPGRQFGSRTDDGSLFYYEVPMYLQRLIN